MPTLERTDIVIAGKLALFLFALGLSLFVLVAGTRAALAASLKDVTVVTGDIITAGDLFEGKVNNADYVLGAAPQPGKDLVLNARTLYRIASSLDIDWRPQSTAQQIVIRRAATIVPASRVEQKLEHELRASGASGNFNIVANSTIENIVLPDNADSTFDIVNLRYEPHNDYFEATVVAPSRDQPLKRVTISGQVEKIIALPVLKTTMRNGELISMSDLDFIDVPLKTLPRDSILDADKIAGQTPRRVAAAGRPLSFNDLQSPQMVGRGEMVTLIFRDRGMTVSSKGRSLQNGAMGELVQVTNASSSKNVAGVVTGLREITVH